MNKGKELLTKLRDGLMTLKPEEFDYNVHVSKSDNNGSGLVCDVLGWTPRFIPEAGFTWIDGRLKTIDSPYRHSIEVFEMKEDVAAFVFLADYADYVLGIDHDDELFGDGSSANLQQVINRITYVIENCY